MIIDAKNLNAISKISIAIDASRSRSGGAKAHLLGILEHCDTIRYGISEVHLWSYKSLMNSIPDYPWLVKHACIQLEMCLLRQLIWQGTSLSNEIKKAKCDILFTSDASSLCRFKPLIVLSQDLLSYEPGIMRLFGYSKRRIRLLTILLVQNRSFRFADGVIFLTNHASKIIQQSCGLLNRVAIISHGVGRNFKNRQAINDLTINYNNEIHCLYISNAALYKHQWVVVKAMDNLRKIGYNISLKLVGGGNGKAQQLLDKQLSISDPHRSFVHQMDFIPQKELPELLARSDVFVFASGCEAFGITLLEAMSMGLPIACSNRSSLPETLLDGGVYFDPEDADSIADAVEQIIRDPELRERISKRAKTISDQYSWQRCGNETWEFIADTYRSIKHEKEKLSNMF